MTPDNSRKRVAAIETLQSKFDGLLVSLDKDLLLTLLSSADKILASPKSIIPILGKFSENDYAPVLTQFGADLLVIRSLNESYFADAVGEELAGELVNRELFTTVRNSVRSLFTDQFGVKPTGEVVSDGLFDLFSRDTTVQRQIQQFAYSQRSSGVGLEKFKKNLKAFVTGTDGKGVYTRHFNTVAYDTYQQADRVAQNAFAAGLNMTAFLYLGGTIAGTRPFCKVRDGKVFLRSEIDKFGTPQDAYGGYEDKATGYFSGKPKVGYSPFISAGGFSCRHSYSALSDREALRRRTDLEKKANGTLTIKPT